jgi:hypothetical protein
MRVRGLLMVTILAIHFGPVGCRTAYRAQDLDRAYGPELSLDDLDYPPLKYAPPREERRPIYAKQINDTLIYPVQSGRAEDYAETLRPILENRYGSGVLIIPHAATNQLIIKIPPYDPEDLRNGGGRSAGRTGTAGRGSARAGAGSGSRSGSRTGSRTGTPNSRR